jgi:hypothetical protein
LFFFQPPKAAAPGGAPPPPPPRWCPPPPLSSIPYQLLARRYEAMQPLTADVNAISSFLARMARHSHDPSTLIRGLEDVQKLGQRPGRRAELESVVHVLVPWILDTVSEPKRRLPEVTLAGLHALLEFAKLDVCRVRMAGPGCFTGSEADRLGDFLKGAGTAFPSRVDVCHAVLKLLGKLGSDQGTHSSLLPVLRHVLNDVSIRQPTAPTVPRAIKCVTRFLRVANQEHHQVGGFIRDARWGMGPPGPGWGDSERLCFCFVVDLGARSKAGARWLS